MASARVTTTSDVAPGWRAMAEGFGVDGGVWGWGASALVSYSVTRWLDVTGGIRALASYGRGNGSGAFKGSLKDFRQTVEALTGLGFIALGLYGAVGALLGPG